MQGTARYILIKRNISLRYVLEEVLNRNVIIVIFTSFCWPLCRYDWKMEVLEEHIWLRDSMSLLDELSNKHNVVLVGCNWLKNLPMHLFMHVFSKFLKVLEWWDTLLHIALDLNFKIWWDYEETIFFSHRLNRWCWFPNILKFNNVDNRLIINKNQIFRY